MKPIYIVLIAAFAALLIYSVIYSAVLRRRLRNEPESVAVGRSMKTAKIWLVIAALWIILSLLRMSDYRDNVDKINSGYWDRASVSRSPDKDIEQLRADMLEKEKDKRDFNIVLLVCWSITFILRIRELLSGRHMHVTARGIYLPDLFVPAEKYSYRISGETLELYRVKKENGIPVKYAIIGEKDRLEGLLAENYAPYTNTNTNYE